MSAPTHSAGRGPEPVDPVRSARGPWAGIVGLVRGLGQVVVGWDKELPVSADHDLSQVTRGGPIRGEQARRNRPAQPRHTLHLPSLTPDIAPYPDQRTRPTITPASSRRARERRVSWAPPDPSTRANEVENRRPRLPPNAA